MPANLREQELLYEVWSTPSDGKAGIVPMTDKRWPAADGWLKMSRYEDGVEIHWKYNPLTRASDDFKFKNQPTPED